MTDDESKRTLNDPPSPSPQRQPSPLPWTWKILRWCAFFLFAFYVVWNIYFLAQGRLAPSMLTGLTGIPSPTTGGTRSIRALLAGEWRESLRLHPLTVPIAGWYFLTLALLIANIVHHKKLRIPAWVLVGWAVLLGVSMVVKLCSPTDTW